MDPNKDHSKQCLANAIIAAVENHRDAAQSDFEFRIHMQDNLQLRDADSYLIDETMTCICPEPEVRKFFIYREGAIALSLFLAAELVMTHIVDLDPLDNDFALLQLTRR